MRSGRLPISFVAVSVFRFLYFLSRFKNILPIQFRLTLVGHYSMLIVEVQRHTEKISVSNSSPTVKKKLKNSSSAVDIRMMTRLIKLKHYCYCYNVSQVRWIELKLISYP